MDYKIEQQGLNQDCTNGPLHLINHKVNIDNTFMWKSHDFIVHNTE